MKRFLAIIILLIIFAFGCGPHPAKFAKEKYMERRKVVSIKYKRYMPAMSPPNADLSYWKSIEQYTRAYERELREAAIYYRDLMTPFQDEIIREFSVRDNNRPIRVTISLNQYISIDELRKMIKEHNIQMRGYNSTSLMKGYNPQGEYGTGWERVGGGGWFDKNGEIPEESKASLSSKTFGPTNIKVEKVFKGVISFEGFVLAKNLKELIENKKVFMVDVTGDEYFGKNPKDKFMPPLHPDSDGIIPLEVVFDPTISKSYK